jgi:hypothetical protein
MQKKKKKLLKDKIVKENEQKKVTNNINFSNS